MSVSEEVDSLLANAECNNKMYGNKGRSLKREMEDKLANAKADKCFSTSYFPDRIPEINDRIQAIEYILATYCRNQFD